MPILVGGLKCQTYFWKGTTQGSFQQSLVEIGSVVTEEKIFLNFIPLFSIFSLVAILVRSRGHRIQFGRGPSKDHSTKVWLQLAPWFLRRRFLSEFPIGSYVKLSSAVAAILVGGMKCRIQFWKGTTQGLFQQSLVEIGSVVSEEKNLLKFHPLFFHF